jgi:serine/threonine protein kinase/predicted ATPase/predicted negative regulator of RcsB-dependent stress response
MREGEIVGRHFQLESRAAAGGMGTVFRARDLRTRRSVALKTCHVDFAAESNEPARSARLERIQTRFAREAKALAEVEDPAIVRYIDHGVSERGEPFLVMAWVEGESLAARLARSGLTVSETLLLGRDLTRALSRLHAHGIVHRDLKPENVMLRDGDPRQPVLVDFGVARRAESASVTLSGARVGTLLYMAPEQIRDPRRVDGRADVFALGCVLFECLTGNRAFAADDALATLARILLDQTPKPRAFRADLPQGVTGLVERLLARDPEQRPRADLALEREFAALAEDPEQLTLGAPDPKPAILPTDGARALQITVEADPERGSTRPLFSARAPDPPPAAPESVNLSQLSGLRRALRERSERFVGRTAELAHLSAWLGSGARLVVVWGPAGIGKTRLVLQASRDGQRSQNELVEFADLGQAQNLDDVIRIVAQQLATSTRGSEGPGQVIGRALGRLGKGLVVLDGVEHLARELGEAIDDWRRVAPDVCFVVTSRQRLPWTGALSLELGPLPIQEPGEGSGLPDRMDALLSPAAELFIDRVRQSEPDFALTPALSRGIENAVSLLEGIPLAIELAAAQVGLLGLGGVLQRLSKQLDLLGRPTLAPDRRHASMRAALRASVELLNDPERQAFAQCAVFSGSFTLEAAEAVLLPESTAVLDLLEALRNKSLLASDPQAGTTEPRLFLFSVIREYALSELRALDGEVALRARHGAYYSRRAVELSAPARRDGETLKRIERDADNLLAAVDWALFKPEPALRLGLEALLSLEPVITARGPLPAYLRLIEAALARASTSADSSEQRLSARVRQLRARLAATSGRYDAARSDLEQVLATARAQADGKLEAAALLDLGVALHLERALLPARAHYEMALALLGQAHDPELEARCYGNIGAILHDGEHLTEAATYYFRAIQLLEECGERRMRGNFLNNLAVLEQELGETARARKHYETALVLLADAGDSRLLAITLGNLGVLEELAADWASARRCHERALALLEPLDDRHSEALCLARLGAALAMLGDVVAADSSLNRALSLSRDGDPHLEAVHLHRAFHHLALARQALGKTGDLAGAEARLERARQLREQARQGSAEAEAPAKSSDDVRTTLRVLSPLLDELSSEIACHRQQRA